MDREGESLADVANTALEAGPRVDTISPDRAVRAERIRAARSRFLPYVVAGGAIACGYLSVVVAGEDNLAIVFGIAVTAGIAAGIAVGWLLIAVFRRLIEGSAMGRRSIDLAIVLLTVPPYLVAGWISALVGWAVAVTLSRPTPEPGPPNAWPLLIASAVVLYPISYAFARRDEERPEDFVGSIRSATTELYEQPRSFVVLGEFLIGLIWFLGSLFAIYGAAIGVQVLFGSQLAGLSIPGPSVAVVFLVIWIGVAAAGTVWTLRRVHRRRPRAR